MQLIDLFEIIDGSPLRGITGNRLKQNTDLSQIRGHSARIGAAKDLLDSGVRIGQIMVKVV